MPEFDSTIEYRPIPGFSNYCAGNDGTVWSRVLRGRPRKGVIAVSDTWHQLKPAPVTNAPGHLFVRLAYGQPRLVHRLILEAFVGPCPPDMECCHNPDPDPANNALGNLRWGTRSDNMRDMIAHGRCSTPAAKLTSEQVSAIRATSGMSQGSLARKHGVTQGTISCILAGKTWKNT